MNEDTTPSDTTEDIQTFSYSQYTRATGTQVSEVRYNDILPNIEFDSSGILIPHRYSRLTLKAREKLALLRPFLSSRIMEQVSAVVPLALYLMLFQVLILRQLVEGGWFIVGGMFAVIVGLMLFMEGLKIGLMPLGAIIGETLPRKLALPFVLIIALLLGVGVTFAEPAIGALKMAGQIVSVEKAPYLFTLLNDYSGVLVLVVGVSVGLATVIGTLRLLYGWSLKPFIYASLAAVMIPTLYMTSDPQLNAVLGLAWDAGAVTTGPVTVPLVLALGVGISAAAGKGEGGLSGFGIVTLASLFPVVGVLLLTLYVASVQSPMEIIQAAQGLSTMAGSEAIAWYERSPVVEVISGIRAILPLVAFLFLILSVILRKRLQKQAEIFFGIGLTVAGMCVFNIGLTYGLSMLGSTAGSFVPTAFMLVDGMPNSPLYNYGFGLMLAIVFAWFLGFGATIAEPALSALGITAEELTNGMIKKKELIITVSFGVAFGIALGLAKLIFNLPLVWLLVGGYSLAIFLTVISSETLVNIAWDSAGVTTGPVTVPLVLALGLGFGTATHAVEGFGILCMASIGPILSVLIFGQWSSYKEKSLLKQSGKNQKSSTLEVVEGVI
ncbi:protein containing DUF1538 [Sulfurimonas gotlandica GD1]|uniref:Protein containing DUF1538 n=1 Tax=Sulfurimonas gotlandica (strain DSM 19862 / JCM 16533 / GD1) TaxID=929558 RepID=B6BLY5_SULGG|nr:DUF1538 domain-containing protein [Sulfurimonas gotlandica]EDZ61889.1 conserved hypothetical protein [Sulfurimonas gotlandica GD1]EHP29441.1 protein containing DUF1538 [Sulfurimonas gotlandica GD1]